MPSSTILHYTDSVCANVYQMSSVTEDLLQSKAEFLPAKESLELNVVLEYGSPISFSSWSTMWFPVVCWSIPKAHDNTRVRRFSCDISGCIKTSTSSQMQTASFMQSLQTDDSRTFCRTWIRAYLRQLYFPYLTCRHEFLQSQTSPQQKHWLSEDNSKFVSAKQKVFPHLQEITTCVA